MGSTKSGLRSQSLIVCWNKKLEKSLELCGNTGPIKKLTKITNLDLFWSFIGDTLETFVLVF